MLTLLLGAPGGGKSYEAVVHHVLPAVKQGRKVITNLPLQKAGFDSFDEGYWQHISLREPKLIGTPGGEESLTMPFSTMDDFADPWRHEITQTGPLYVIDEAHIPLPTRGVDKKIEHWFSMHRHETADVVIITQDHGKINRNIKVLSQHVYYCRKALVLGMSGRYIFTALAGLDKKSVVKRELRRYKKQYFPLYQSHTKGGGNEAFGKTATLWKNPMVILAGLVLVFAVYRVASGGIHLFPEPPTKAAAVRKVDAVENRPAVSAELPAQQPVPQALPYFANYPFKGEDFRIGGRVRINGHEVVYISMRNRVTAIRRTVTLDHLNYAGWAVRDHSACAISLSFFDGQQHEMQLATCDSFPRWVGISTVAAERPQEAGAAAAVGIPVISQALSIKRQ